MIREIHFENYRGFKRYRMKNLTRVNLLVGQNNSGKTSVLEAVQLLAAGGNPDVLSAIARQRGELIHRSERSRPDRQVMLADITHFFHGHGFGPGATFKIQLGDGLPSLTFRICTPDDGGLELDKLQDRSFRDAAEMFGPVYALELDAQPSEGKRTECFPVSIDGGLVSETRLRIPQSRRFQTLGLSTQFITPESLLPESLAGMWNRLVHDRSEEQVIRAMQILEPEINDIHFLAGDQSYRYSSRAGVLVGCRNEKRRVPLGSFGEGMRRLLSLSLSLAQAAGGFLLVDEIDTGLHWSIMSDMWRLIVTTAIESDTQVFASTHSLDCLRGLAQLCETHPDFEQQVSVHTIDRGLDEAISFDASQLELAVEQEIEVR